MGKNIALSRSKLERGKRLYKHIIVNAGDLIPYANNSRTHADGQVAQIAASMKEWGFTNPLLIDEDNSIIAGHGRLLAAQKLGIEQIPCILLDGLTEAQKKAYVIADNRLALNAGWDDELLKLELSELDGEEFDLDLLGFDESELMALLDGESEDGLTDEDAVPDIPEVPISVEGDVWILGNHRLMCGDSTSIDAVEKLMGGQKADMVFTDPPYNQETDGGKGGDIGAALRKQGSDIEHICDFEPSDFLNVLPAVFEKNKINTYIFCNNALVPDYLSWARDAGYSFNILVWKKPNGIPINSAHRPDVEYMLLFRKSSIFNYGLKGVNYSRVMEYGRESGLHPTMKPVEMIENQLQIGSSLGGPVVDLFGGSGSTLIACEETNRNCRMMELDPKYVDVIIKRWQDFTGKQAVHEDGVKFDDR